MGFGLYDVRMFYNLSVWLLLLLLVHCKRIHFDFVERAHISCSGFYFKLFFSSVLRFNSTLSKMCLCIR